MASENVTWTALCLGVLCLSLTPSSSAWSNGGYSSDYSTPDYGTHDWIADHALALQTNDFTFLSETFHARFLLGTEAPDNPDLIGDTLQHHVYYYSSGIIQEDNAADRAAQFYESALADLELSDYSDAAYHIGIMCHYITDAGAYGHTMGTATDWGAEVHHSDYEDEMNSLVASYSPAVVGLAEQLDAYSSTLWLAKEVTFGNGTIRSSVWMDQNYNLSNTDFVASAKASLVACVKAAASAINSLMAAANIEPPSDDDTTDDGPKSDPWRLVALGAVIAGVTTAIVMVIRRTSRR